MPAIRVLVVDDSVVIRKVLTEVLSADPGIEVAGTAADGSIALAKILQVKPDLVTLDVEMPGLSGLETLAAIRKSYPKLPVIMFSTLTERGAGTTLDALALGASDYVTKPQHTGGLDTTRIRIQAELVPKVKGLCVPAVSSIASGAMARPKSSSWAQRIDIVAIGTSTGGPNALAEVLPALPANFPVPVLVVQHMPPLFTRMLADRLDRRSQLRIHEGAEGDAVNPGHVFIAPGDFHMKVVRESNCIRLAMSQDPPQNSCRPAVDVLFESVARVFGPNILGVVLTGMGSDGVRGSQQIKQAGGSIFVQDEATSVVWGMPGQVAASGLADSIFPLKEMAKEIESHARHNRSSGTRPPQSSGHAAVTPPKNSQTAVKQTV